METRRQGRQGDSPLLSRSPCLPVSLSYQFMEEALRILAVLLLMVLLVACGSGAPENVAVEEVAQEATAVAEFAPEGAAPPPGYEGQTWADIVAEARGQTVNFYMWGGSDLINRWVTEEVGQAVKEQYGVTLNLVPVADSPEYM
jgi:hypothetical protein